MANGCIGVCVRVSVCLFGGGLRLSVIRICVSCGCWLPSIALCSAHMLISVFSLKSPVVANLYCRLKCFWVVWGRGSLLPYGAFPNQCRLFVATRP